MNITTQNKLEYLKDTKTAIKNALIEKGQTVEDSDTFRSYAEKIAAIESSSPDVRYVTFMSYDGLTEYGKKAVAVGDDCADPIARGIFGTPTRESDVQNDYSFANGWSTEPNGTAVSGWSKAVTEDKVVYAVFNSTLRKYTITYYDEDGTTMLNTESLPYGTMPSYEPTHPTDDTLMFDYWTPELETVTGDATYTVKWKQKATFSTASWDEIAEICNDGRASTTFALGDTKDVVLTYDDGTTETVTFEIVDMNLTSTKFNGIGGKQYGNIALLATHTLKDPQKYVLSMPGTNDSVLFGYSNCEMTNVMKKLSNCLPEDAYNAIKTITVGSIYYSDVKFVLPSTGNILGKRWHRSGTSSYPKVPEQQLEIFKNGRTKISKDASGNAVKCWTSSCEATKTSGANRPIYVDTSGAMAKESSLQAHYIRLLCFI